MVGILLSSLPRSHTKSRDRQLRQESFPNVPLCVSVTSLTRKIFLGDILHKDNYCPEHPLLLQIALTMNNKLVLLLRLAVAVGMAAKSIAFSSSRAASSSSHAVGLLPSGGTGTALRSIIIEPPPGDDCNVDGSDCEESIFDRKRREKAEAENATRERYQKRGIELTDVDLMESPDQYRNAQLGGGRISGVNLSALCEDD